MNITNPTTHESTHVHSVYQTIAPHFSQTRYKPWPLISSFLLSLPPGSVGVDLGCGNGKYLSINPKIYILASDRSSNLIELAQQYKHTNDVAVADLLDNPHPKGRFDFAISIAVIHHFASRERRVEGVRGVLETLNNWGGRGLVYVWALEQKGSRRGWDEGDCQDVFVPWVMKNGASGSEGGEKTMQRYYHLYKKGELEEDVETAGGEVVESGYEKDNWWVIMKRKDV